jgi:hypothetical protein
VNNFVIEDPHNRSHTLGVQILSPKTVIPGGVKRPRPQAGYHLRHTTTAVAPPNNNNQEHHSNQDDDDDDAQLNSEDLGIYEADSSSLGGKVAG